MHCPHCVGALEPVAYDGVDLDVCMFCRGLWFDQGELAKFNHFDADFPLGPGKPIEGEAIGGLCPRCGVAMTPMRYAPRVNFEVDRCANCGGVWLDNGEIRKIQQLVTDEVKLWLKIGSRLDEVVVRERTLWEQYNAELAKHEAAAKMSATQWLFLFLTRLPREVYNPVHCRPKITIALIVTNVVVFVLVGTFLKGTSLLLFLVNYGFVPAQLSHLQHLWSLVTALFIHGNLAHIIGNMYFLYTFGDNVEDVLGSWTFFGLYLLCGVTANLAHFVTNTYSLIPTIGASGAISGILGAYSFLFRRRKIYFLVIFWPIKVSAVYYLLFWVEFQILAASHPLPLGRAGVAYDAHIGGFVAGVLLTVCHCAWKKHTLSRTTEGRPLPAANV
jgi:membrane associated rhomboid family serine protease